MLPMEAIVAFSKDFGIGFEGTLPWNVPEDLNRFRELTIGNLVIVGRKTFESFKVPLPGRTTIVVTSQVMTDTTEVKFRTLAQVPDELEKYSCKKFVCGGAGIYHHFMPSVTTLHVAHIHMSNQPCDVFFPTDQLVNFRLVASERQKECTFLTYDRRPTGLEDDNPDLYTDLLMDIMTNGNVRDDRTGKAIAPLALRRSAHALLRMLRIPPPKTCLI